MPITRAHAIVFADAVNLRAGDLPGLKGGQLPEKREIMLGPFEPVMKNCDPAMIHSGDVVGIISPYFTRATAHKPGSSMSLNFASTEGVQSVVYVMESPTLASRELATIDSARGRACVKRFAENETATKVRKGASAEKPLFSHVAVSALPSSPLRGVSAFGLRITAPVAASNTIGGVHYYEDFLGFVVGPALVMLIDDGYNPGAFPLVAEQHLLTVLYQRAKTHKL
jgi:hypothetical protein